MTLSPDDQSRLAALLRREGNRFVARIVAGDPQAVVDALLAAAQECDELAARIGGEP